MCTNVKYEREPIVATLNDIIFQNEFLTQGYDFLTVHLYDDHQNSDSFQRHKSTHRTVIRDVQY